MSPVPCVSLDRWCDIISSLTSLFWNSNVIVTVSAKCRFSVSLVMSRLFEVKKRKFLTHSNFVLRSPCKSEYSHERIQKKNASVSNCASALSRSGGDDTFVSAAIR
jgi:hypothetical protein